jgi:hypothetical protein
MDYVFLYVDLHHFFSVQQTIAEKTFRIGSMFIRLFRSKWHLSLATKFMTFPPESLWMYMELHNTFDNMRLLFLNGPIHFKQVDILNS